MKEIKEILKDIKECEARTLERRDLAEEDFGLLRLEPYCSDKEKKPNAKNFTTNSASVLGHKLIETLAYSKLKLRIEITDENQKERDALSLTERLDIGSIRLADQRLKSIPGSGGGIQSQLSFHAPIRGFVALRFLMKKEDDLVIPDVAVWDWLNTRWGAGTKGLEWACYRRWASASQLKEEYGDIKHAKADKQGRIEVWDAWDKNEEGVFVGEEWIQEPEPHGLNYVPVYIREVGSTPFIQSSKFDDTFKDVGVSCFANNRHIYKLESEILSDYRTIVQKAAKNPLVIEWDSTKGDKPEPEQDPNVPGGIVYVDTSKGQSIGEFVKSEMPRDAAFLLSNYMQQLSMGGMAPIAYGQINQQMPAALGGMLTRAAMSVLKPAQLAIEEAFEWLCEEINSQYTNGDFGEMTLQGVDSTNRRFRVEVLPDKINTDWKVECDLVPDLLQDKLENAGLALQLKEARLWSRQTAMDEVGVEDVDSEIKKIQRENAEGLAEVDLMKAAVACIDDKDYSTADILLMELHRRMGGQRQAQGVNNQAGLPMGMPPQAQVAQRGMPNVQNQEQQRLANLGMVRGR